MRYHKLDLNLLTALKALLAEKNVTRAGEAVHVTQSAMSGILARLRDYFTRLESAARVTPRRSPTR